ncbi:PLxRFG domain-containing protein [Enterovibrio sp. 27052020O]|uniref:PLxRFG domain-containing protein n=1 Tax=Enterovibrio sp. 27052020O TaxID=3241166 RepID=UPI0038904910
MQDKLLGNNPDATVNARTDMSFELGDDFDLNAYAPTRDLEVTAGDVGKSVAIGAMGAVEGGAEPIRQGQSYLGDKARDLGVPDALIEAANYTPQGLAANYISFAGEQVGKVKDWLTDTLTDDGKQAMNTMPVSESPEGDWKFSTDPAVWGMQLAQGVGYMAPTVASAIATGGMSSTSAIQSLTNMAMRAGAKPDFAAKAGNLAYNTLAKSPTAAVAMGSDVGSQGQQAKESVQGADFAQLMNSETFRSEFLALDDDPEFAYLSDIEKLEEARNRTANAASRATMTDPLTLGSSVAATLLGDLPLANALVKGSGKGIVKGAAVGAVREGPTEAAQGAAQQYVSNQVSNEYAGTDLDAMDGVALGAVNEGLLGSAIGSGMGAVGGARGGSNDATQADPVEGVQSEPQADVQGDVAVSAEDAPLTNTAEPAVMAEDLTVEPVVSDMTEEASQGTTPQQATTPQDDLKQRLAASRQTLRDKSALSDPQDHHLKTLKLAYALDPEKTDALLDRMAQGDESAEQGVFALAEQASQMELDDTGVQQFFDDAVAKRNAGAQAQQNKIASNTERYIQALEQGRQNVDQAKNGPLTQKPYQSPKDPRLAQWEAEEAAKPSRPSFDPAMARAEILKRESDAERAAREQKATSIEADPREVALQQQAASERAGMPKQADVESGGVTRTYQREQERRAADTQKAEQEAQRDYVTGNVEQSQQSRGGFADRPNSMRMREQGRKPISDFTDTVKKTKTMRKRLKQRMVKANPQLADALLDSLRSAPERLAAFEAEAQRRQAYEDALPENKARRAKAESLFTPQTDEAAIAPDFERNAIMQVVDDMRARGEQIISGLPKQEQAAARADLNKAQDFVQSRLRLMMDEAKANRTKKLKDFTPRFQPKTPDVQDTQGVDDAQQADNTQQAEGAQGVEPVADAEPAQLTQGVDDAAPTQDADMVDKAKAVIRDVLKANGGKKLTGVRAAYKTQGGFTAKELDETLKAQGHKGIADFEREVKAEGQQEEKPNAEPVETNEPAPTAYESTPDTDGDVTTQIGLLNAIKKRVKAGYNPSNNNSLKDLAKTLFGLPSAKDVDPLLLKKVQEAYETVAVVKRRSKATKILAEQNNPLMVKEVFRQLKDDYERQPNLDVRTAKSSDFQAYSTPAPMSYLANLAAGVDKNTIVYEPTAGNGLLLMLANPANTFANELDPVRAEALAWTGFETTVQDATRNAFEGIVSEPVDAVITNPPFGTLRDANRKPIKHVFTDALGNDYKFGEIDHLIAKQALDAMKVDGKATLILGAPKEAGDYTGNNKVFLNWLYRNHNVVHHVEIDGKLYKGQGAAWPIQMIVVHGRATSGTGKHAPVKGKVKRVSTWDELYDDFNEKGLVDTTGREYQRYSQSVSDVKAQREPKADDVSRQGKPSELSGRRDQRTAGRGNDSDGGSAGDNVRQLRNGDDAGAGFRSQPDVRDAGLAETGNRDAPGSENSRSDDQSKGNRRPDVEPVRELSAEPTRTTKAGPVQIDAKVERANEFQSYYKTASNGFNEGVLTPTNMASYTQSALADIQRRHGSVDSFVMDRLGYSDAESLHRAFMGLQTDAVALAVDAIENGRAIVIGDQTGVGKGRQAAGVIRYAMQKGKIPVFVTQKPNLFTDMYDDLADIGVEDFTPLIMNQDKGFVKKGNAKLFNYSDKERSRLINELSSGELPDGHSALFLTYSQISSDNTGNKRRLLDDLAKNAVFVLDESHSAAGSDSKLGKAFQHISEVAHGVAYLSATYAKRPENMSLYMRTDLGLATDNRSQLISAVEQGGLGMQTYIAGKLAEAGQMLRRERSFDGIKINNHVITDKTGGTKETYDRSAEALRAIQDMSSAFRRYIEKDMAQEIQEERGLDVVVRGNKADGKPKVTEFSSVVHNYISQMTLGLKAKEIASLALKAIGEGKRPVIALENTMQAALERFMDRNGFHVGDQANGLTYGELLKNVLDGVLYYGIKEPGEKKSEKVYLSIDEITDPLVQYHYNRAIEAIDSLGADGIPASPIDAIRHEIEKAGKTVAEITGRSLMVDEGDGMRIVSRSAAEVSDRRGTVDKFNNGELDVLILNQAGSTGLSLHARADYGNTDPRHMIVAQPSLNIDTFMQMLGRVNRTGQIHKPTYDIAWLDLPSEKRPAAVLARKMTGLNANTSGNTESATSVESIDLLNMYGDEVVGEYVAANFEMLNRYSKKLTDLPFDDRASYFLGKLAVLPVDIQQSVLEDLEAAYRDLIEYLDATGQNELNMTELDLDAKPLAQKMLSKKQPKRGVFSEPVYLTKVDAKANGKAPDWAEAQELVGASSQASFDAMASAISRDTRYVEGLTKRRDSTKADLESKRKDGKKVDALVEEVGNLDQAIRGYQSRLNEVKALFQPGGMYAHGAFVNVKLDADTTVSGVISDVSHTHSNGNPLSPSKFKIKVVVANRARSIPLNLKQAEEGALTRSMTNAHSMKMLFDRKAKEPGRETRYIMTGNLVEAQTRTDKKGRIVPFTTSDGRVIQGMLLPQNFKADENIKEKADATPKQMVDWLQQTDGPYASMGLSTADGDVKVYRSYDGDYKISMPKSVAKGKRYWGNPAIEKVIGEQAVKGGGLLHVSVPQSKLLTLIKAMDAINPLGLRNNEQVKDFARSSGKAVAGFSKEGIKFSREAITQGANNVKGMPLKQAELGVKQWLKEYRGGGGVKVRVVKTQAEAEQMLGESFPDATIHAFYHERSASVVVVADNIPDMKALRQKLRHEVVVHHGLKSVVGDSEYQKILERVFSGRQSKSLKPLWDQVLSSYADQDAVTQVEEVLAHAAEMERNAIQQWWDRVVEAIAHALRRVGLMKPSDMTRAEMNNIVQTLVDRMKSVNHWDPETTPPGGGSKLSRSKLSKAKFSKTQNMTFDQAIQQVGKGDTAQTRFKSALSAASLAVKGVLGGKLGLGAVSLRQLSDLSKDTLPMVKTYVDTVHRMLTRRNQMAFESAEIAQDLRKWAGKNQDAADKVFEMAHDATVEGVDPDKAFVSAEDAITRRIEYLENVNEGSHKTKAQMDEMRQLRKDLINEPQRKAKHAELKAEYDKLPEQAKVYYRSMRDNYKRRHDDYRQLLEQQIQSADIDGRVKKKRIAELRTLFELQEVNAPYFPLTRFGDYWLSAVDENGEQRYMMFEKEKEQQATAEHLRKQGFSVSTGYKMEGNPAINGASLSFVTDLMHKIDDTTLNDLKKEEIKDSIYQMYLQALPSRSMRKQFIHRKKVKGWSNDALRAMASNMMKGAYQLARMEYADELTKQASEAKKAAEVSGNNQAGRYAEELMKRHEWVMNPTHSKAAQTITSIGFLWMLGVSPAAAAINTTQNFVVALPILASKFGTTKAASALTGTMKEFIAGKGSIQSKLRNYDEKDAYQQWHDMGLLDSTNAHDLAGMAEAENWQYNETYEKGMNMVSALFHKAEVFNRETTVIAGYRLAREKGMSHEAAVKAAADITWDAHFDYTNVNRARYMQSPTMKVITQFKQYSQNMSYYLLRNLYIGFKGASKEEKAEARKQLVGTMGVTALLGGASALPLGTLYAIANALQSAFGDEDEPYDAEVEFKSYLADAMGDDMASLVLYGAGGAGLSPRISLDGLWIRDANRDLEGQDLWTHYAQQVAGPVLGGVVVGAIRGTQDIAQGEYQRGIEKILPKFARDPLKAMRYGDEGALNYRGDAYKEADEFAWYQLLAQGMGLSDHELMKQYEINNGIKGYEKHITDRRRDLMTAYWLAVKQGDTALLLETQKQIGKFNRTNPRVAIDAKDIRQSIKTRRRYSEQNQKGVNVNKNLRHLNDQIGW